MPDRSSITDESVMKRWMQMEISRINESIVIERKTLAAVYKEETSSARTKSGKEYPFNRQALKALWDQAPPDIRDRLKVPILFHFDMDVPDSCYVTDEVAIRALQSLGEISLLRTPQKGRVWVSRAIVYAMIRKYPTIIQIVMG